jgi:hypothetical protein
MPDNTKIQDHTPIWGASAIARELGRDRAAAYYLLEADHLPARTVSMAQEARKDFTDDRELGQCVRYAMTAA